MIEVEHHEPGPDHVGAPRKPMPPWLARLLLDPPHCPFCGYGIATSLLSENLGEPLACWCKPSADMARLERDHAEQAAQKGYW